MAPHVPLIAAIASGFLLALTVLYTAPQAGLEEGPDGALPPAGPVSPPTPPAQETARLPDLETEVPDEIYIEETRDGERLLRFSTTVMNSGDGTLELRGERDPATEEVTATQIIEQPDGGMREHHVGNLVRSDTHEHWHLERFALFELWPAQAPEALVGPAATQNKITFCLLDEARIDPGNPAAAEEPKFLGCDWEHQGISAGWSETYVASLPEQWVDITGLPDGAYLLRVTLDPDGLLQEADRRNNTVTAVVEIREGQAEIL